MPRIRSYGAQDAGGGYVLPSYATDFAVTENPLQYGGQWRTGLAQGLDWTNPQTAFGASLGTQSGSGATDDSIGALSKVWTKNQRAWGVIRKGSPVPFQEVEILLRFQIAPHVAMGYEVNLACDGAYCDIELWYQGQFFQIAIQIGGLPVPQTGDIFMAEIIGFTINAYLNGALIHTGDIRSGTAGAPPIVIVDAGSPGEGFFQSNGHAAGNDQFEFDKFTAIGLP